MREGKEIWQLNVISGQGAVLRGGENAVKDTNGSVNKMGLYMVDKCFILVLNVLKSIIMLLLCKTISLFLAGIH